MIFYFVNPPRANVPMKASETSLQSVIEGAKQYIVPLYQRAYSWEKKQWQKLWDDLVELCEADGPRSHFLGSIVSMQTTSVPEGVPKYFLIDGQQRLTTVFILLALLRDEARTRGELLLGDEIENTLLVNQYKKGNDYFKILPTQGDRPSIQALIVGGERDAGSQITAAYRFFQGKMRPGTAVVRTLVKILTESLSVVSIVLDRDDNPYLVFESLNATGRPLSQADLIRNFFFLKIHSDRQDEMHARFWEPMQAALGERLTEYIRHYLMKGGTFIRGDSVYFTLKEKLGAGDAVALLEDLARSASVYKRFLDPTTEPDPAIREALTRLNRLDVTTAYPFLLQCYDDYTAGNLPAQGLRDILACLENFLVRRLVCGVPTNQLNKLFLPLYNQIASGDPPGLVEALRAVLPTKGYPKDAEFRERLVDTRLYGAGDRRARTKFLLESLEWSFGHKEATDPDSLNIEHVMPRTLTDSWRAHLGDDWETTHDLLLDTLGNLTLTGYNPELSNADFATKQSLLAKSHVQLNDYFASASQWRAEEIERRGEALADVALRIWPAIGSEQTAPEPAPIASGRPASLSFLGGTYSVESWRDVLEETLNAIGDRDPALLATIASALPSLVHADGSKFRASRLLRSGLYANTHMSAKSVVRSCRRLLDVAEIPASEWIVGSP